MEEKSPLPALAASDKAGYAHAAATGEAQEPRDRRHGGAAEES